MVPSNPNRATTGVGHRSASATVGALNVNLHEILDLEAAVVS